MMIPFYDDWLGLFYHADPPHLNPEHEYTPVDDATDKTCLTVSNRARRRHKNYDLWESTRYKRKDGWK